MGDSVSGWYAFLIEKKGNLNKWWSNCGWDARADDIGWGGGIRQDVPRPPKDFARELLDVYLDRLVTEQPETVEYLLFEDDQDTQLRVRVWNIPVVDADRLAAGCSVPEPGTRDGRGYAWSLSGEGFEPTSVVTLPSMTVQARLRRRLDEE